MSSRRDLVKALRLRLPPRPQSRKATHPWRSPPRVATKRLRLPPKKSRPPSQTMRLTLERPLLRRRLKRIAKRSETNLNIHIQFSILLLVI